MDEMCLFYAPTGLTALGQTLELLILSKTADIYLAIMNVVLTSIRPRAFVNFRALSTAVRYSVNGQAKDVYK